MTEQDPIEPFKEAVRVARDSGDARAFGDALNEYYYRQASSNYESSGWDGSGTILVLTEDWLAPVQTDMVVGHLTPQEFYDWLGGDGLFDNKPAD